MIFVPIALAVFFVVSTAQNFIEMDLRWWLLVMLVLSGAGLALCGDLRWWYGSPAIAGIGLLVLRVENLLMVKADESLVAINRRR
jgi:hypothetical protein